jgi:hypothetical protein
LDYKIWYDNANGVANEVLTEGVQTTTYTATGLTQGLTYRFKVQARNIYGFSLGTTNEVIILAAQIPDVPSAPVTSFIANSDTVQVNWVAPNDGGSPITSYTVYFADLGQLNFIAQPAYCDGSDQTIMANTLCTIPSIVLHEAPFNLPWASSIYVKVIATNAYGSSE